MTENVETEAEDFDIHQLEQLFRNVLETDRRMYKIKILKTEFYEAAYEFSKAKSDEDHAANFRVVGLMEQIAIKRNSKKLAIASVGILKHVIGRHANSVELEQALTDTAQKISDAYKLIPKV
jgi:hypothetical protein